MIIDAAAQMHMTVLSHDFKLKIPKDSRSQYSLFDVCNFI